MISKNIWFILLIAIQLNAFAKHEVPLTDYAEKISGGKINEDLEIRIKKILSSFDLKTIPHVRNISVEMLDTNPMLVCEVYQKYDCYYINEHFFSLLNDEELTAILAYNVYGLKVTKPLQKEISKIVTWGQQAGIVALVGTWATLINKMPELGQLSAFLYGAIARSAVLKIMELRANKLAKTEIFYKDKCIVQKIGSPHGLVGLLKKISAYDPVDFDTQLLQERITVLENPTFTPGI